MKQLIEAHKRATLGMLLRHSLRSDEPMSYNDVIAAAGDDIMGLLMQEAALSMLAADEYLTDGYGDMTCALTDKGRTWARQLEKELHVLCEENGVECPCLVCMPIDKNSEGENDE